MSTMRKIILLTVAVAALPSVVASQSIDDLAWIAGIWATDLGDQALEERWSPPLANAMTGSFRWSREGEVWLYEFLLIEETADGIRYYLRHFGPGSTGWEERDAPLAYQLSALEENRAVFDSVNTPGDSFIFSREGDQLTIEIVSGDDVKRFVYSARNEPADAETPPASEPAAASE